MQRSRFTQIATLLLAAILAANLLWLEVSVLHGARFGNVALGVVGMAGLAALVFGAALYLLLRPAGARHPRARGFAVALAMLLTIRFHLPTLLLRYPPSQGTSVELAPTLVARMRELSAAEEQYRLEHGSYASVPDSLARWQQLGAIPGLTLEARGKDGWSASAREHDVACTIEAALSGKGARDANNDGVPRCGTPIAADGLHAAVRGDSCAWSSPASLPAAVSGVWLQHRGNGRRTGSVDDAGRDAAAYRWSTRVCGGLRASAAIAGDQVFVGAHENGELAALSLQDGHLQFRLRAPNWIHHEPVITPDLAIVGFGNNERNPQSRSFVGSAPSGIAAYDRRTGVERWRRYTMGSVMTSPVVLDSIVAVVTGAHEALAWRISDGAPLWRNSLPGYVPMGNPLLLDDRLVVGAEPAIACAFAMRTGASLYCRNVDARGSGAGHASVSGRDTLALLTYVPELTGRRWRAEVLVRRVLGIPFIDWGMRAQRSQTLVAFDPRNGREYWRLVIATGTTELQGHVAGTPVLVGDMAYVVTPVSGELVAVNLPTRSISWKSAARVARGSVFVADSLVFAAMHDGGYVVLDARTGREHCRGALPVSSDRAGLTVSGETGILTLKNGLVLARPVSDWLACRD